MKRETAVAIYFWTCLVAAAIMLARGETTAWAVLIGCASIIGAGNVIARDYFDQ